MYQVCVKKKRGYNNRWVIVLIAGASTTHVHNTRIRGMYTRYILTHALGHTFPILQGKLFRNYIKYYRSFLPYYNDGNRVSGTISGEISLILYHYTSVFICVFL